MSCHPNIRHGQFTIGSRSPGTPLLATSLVLALSLAAVQPLAAQTVVNVNAPGSLTTATGTTTPAADDTWNLNSTGIFLNTTVMLPFSPPGLTINGNGHTLTLNDGAGNFGSFFANTGTGATLNLPTDLTIAGGQRTGADPFVLANVGSAIGGGAILSLGPLAINGAAGQTITLTDNHAVTDPAGTGGTGGAIYAQRVVSIATTAGNVVISNNSVLGGPAANDGGFGGAIATFDGVAIGNPSGTVVITGNSASNPVGSGGSGGAIWMFNAFGSGSVTITGSTVTLSNNSANGAGGGIATFADGPVTINGNLIANDNTAVRGGGAIFTTNGADVTVHGSVSMNHNQSTDLTGQDGGAIWGAGNVSLAAVQGEGDVSLTNNRSFGGNGGAVFSQATLTIGNATGTVTMTGNTAAANGGAAAAVGDVLITGTAINLSSDTIVNNISAGGVGGSVAAGGALTVTLTGSTPLIANNNVAFDSGGALYAASGDVTVNGSAVMNNNTSGNFGGAIASQVGNVIVTGSLSADNNRANADGGVIAAIDGGSVSLVGAGTDVTLTNNQARNGGAVSVSLCPELSGNCQGRTAGTLALGNATGTLTLTGNTARARGGALYSDGATTLFNANISNNTAGSAGGAVYSVGPFTLTTTMTSTISNNTAVAGTGGAIWAGGDVTLDATGGDVTFSGNIHQNANFGIPQANAIFLNNTGGTATATFNAAAGHSITFFDPIQSNAANGLVSVTATGGGAVVFDASLHTALLDRWSQLYGNTEVQGGTTFTVDNNAVYSALATDVGGTAGGSSFTVDSGATLAGGIVGEVRADNFTLNGTFNIAGSAPPGNASGGFSNFTVTSNNVSFGSGSLVLFNTYLNDADVQRTDLLTLTLHGSATHGTAGVIVTNVGGPGGLTTGNGIELEHETDNNGTTAGAFTLVNPELRGGFYDYRLFHGSIDASGPENWYLRSNLIPETGPEPVPPLILPPEVLPPEPPPLTPGPGFPIIGPEIATYGVVQPMAQQLGRAMLGTHDERLGDLYQVPCEPETNAPAYTKAPVYTKAPTTDCGGWRPAVWGRLFGQQIDNHYQAFADPRADGQIAGLQAGVDILRSDSLIPGHRDYAGFYAAYGNANVDVTGLITNAAATGYVLQHTGSLNLNAYSGGVYWTHYGLPGWYVDLTLQGTSYSGGASTEFAHLNTNGSGFISSLEGGYPIALPVLGPGFVLEPQAQVLWQWVSFDAGNDGLGPVALGTTSTTTARVGVKGKWTITTNGGQVWQPYVRANYWNDFGGNATTMFGIDSVPLISHAQYMDIDAGFTTKIDAHLSAFTEAGYQFAVSHDGGGKRDGVKGTAGLRYQW